MRFFVYTALETAAPRKPASPERIVDVGRFMEESREAGIVVARGWLPEKSARIRVTGGKVSITDGPFVEGKELIPGFMVIEADTREKAIDWALQFRSLADIEEVRVAQVRAPA